jgi:hypothetical protein
MEDTLEDLVDVVEADSSPTFSPGPVSIPSPPSTTKSGRKSTPRKRKARADDVALVSPPVKAARNQLTAAEIRHNGKLEATWKKYIGHWRRFYLWLSRTGREEHLNPGEFDLNSEDIFGSIVVPIPDDIFDEYLIVIGHNDKNLLKHKSVPEGFWSTLVHIYGMQKPRIEISESSALRARWRSFALGFKKTRASDVVTEGLTPYEGRDSMTRKAFRNMQRMTLQPRYCTPSQMLWVPQMNAGSRCLIQRINNIGQLTFTTMRWKNDALCVTIPRHKGDTKGERMMERHIHANPYDPLSCFIFWLGVRLLSHTSVGKSHYVFGDELAADIKSTGKKKTSHTDEAFALWMRTATKDLTVEEKIRDFDGLVNQLGTHFNRNGPLRSVP